VAGFGANSRLAAGASLGRQGLASRPGRQLLSHADTGRRVGCLCAADATGEYQEFDRDGINFAEIIKQQTPPRATILHAPVHNTPVFLTGRRSLMGYPGHIWTHGLDYGPRETEIKRIYAGAPDAESHFLCQS